MSRLRRDFLCAAAALASWLALTGQAGRALAEDVRSPMSAEFERFRFSFFEDPNSARDSLDTPTLEKLEGEERSRAEDMLIAFLPDSRAVIGLGALRSRRGEPQLVKLFEAERRQQLAARHAPDSGWYPFALLYLARALWLIDPDPRWAEAAIDALGSSADWTARMHAAEALYDVRLGAAVEALVKALDDSDGLVRYHATRALLAIHGLPADPKDLQHMMYRVMSDDAERREAGKRDILAAIAGWGMLPL
jgi:HEAT repeats